MRRKIVIMLINLGLGLFTVSMFLISARETHISETRDNITCDIIKLIQFKATSNGNSYLPK